MNIAGPLRYNKLHASSEIRSTGREVALCLNIVVALTPKPPRLDKSYLFISLKKMPESTIHDLNQVCLLCKKPQHVILFYPPE